jgi:hypothetical protein
MLKLDPTRDPKFVQAHQLARVLVVLIQLAVCIIALESSGYTNSICYDTIPEIPHLLVLLLTNSTASKSWANWVSTNARKAQPFLGILSKLLRKSNIRFKTEHIPGVSNHGLDFIS